MESDFIVDIKISKKLKIIGIGLLLLIPFPYTVVPKWEFTIVDELGQTLPNISVSQSWQHYSFESSGHREEGVSNSNGVIIFPKRTIYISIGGMIFKPIANTLRTGFHTSYGASSWIIGSVKPCQEGIMIFESYYSGLPNRMVLRTRANCEKKPSIDSLKK